MKLLLEAEIEAHACFPPDQKDFIAKVVSKRHDVEFYLKNGNVEMGIETPTMIAVLVFDGEDFESGLEKGRDTIDEILRSLAFITSSTFKYRRSIKLIDWSDEHKERDYQAFQPFPGHQLPHYILEPRFILSALVLWEAAKDHPMALAVHWFASGVAATSLEDQFQLFWFSVELLADYTKPSEKVYDACPVCRSPLYCEKCGKHPKHRPFNKQAIEFLMKGIVGDEHFEEVSKRAFKTRNMLMHGSTRDQIEAELGIGMDVCVNDMARIAKQAIHTVMNPEIAKIAAVDHILFLDIEDYSHKLMTLKVRMRTGPVEAKIANLGQIVVPEMSLIYSEKPSEEG